ncbi:MAG: hypothetical protein HY941_07900 [Gammaproteobacteria bacterium]|nr:hypothetical protein [Gammaproteobacteria bacterium]
MDHVTRNKKKASPKAKTTSSKAVSVSPGEGVVDQLARHLARTLPGLRGFTRRNLFRMRQFFETYASDKIVSPLVTLLPWTHNLVILEGNLKIDIAISTLWKAASINQDSSACQTRGYHARIGITGPGRHPEKQTD